MLKPLPGGLGRCALFGQHPLHVYGRAGERRQFAVEPARLLGRPRSRYFDLQRPPMAPLLQVSLARGVALLDGGSRVGPPLALVAHARERQRGSLRPHARSRNGSLTPRAHAMTGTAGRIVLLNGTSSSGKTTIARELQGILPGTTLSTGIDHFSAGCRN